VGEFSKDRQKNLDTIEKSLKTSVGGSRVGGPRPLNVVLELDGEESSFGGEDGILVCCFVLSERERSVKGPEARQKGYLYVQSMEG